jgi:WD40 repeat protein
VNLDGPVRVADNAGSGTATVTLSLDAWKGVPVAPTTHAVTVLPPKAAKTEPVAPGLIASLSHPQHNASLWQIAFSPDGARLFTSGFTSGIVQIWDVASRKEQCWIDTSPGVFESTEYALLTPDWKTLYVPVEKRTVKPIEKDGKRVYRIDYAGEIRVWDIASCKQKVPHRPAPGSASGYAKLSPNGRFLVCIEQRGYDTSQVGPEAVTVVWDLATRRKRKLCDGNAGWSFAPDGKTAAISLTDYQSKTSAVKLLGLATGKELAAVTCLEKGRYFSVRSFSPDRSVVAVSLGGKKGAPVEVWFLDARTLEGRGKLIGKGDPEGYGGSNGMLFTPDGKRFAVLDGAGNVLLWDVVGQRVERTLPSPGASRQGWQLAVSPDSKTLAVGWAPQADVDLESAADLNPEDLPQPRVSLIDLAGDAPPRVLIAPHGSVGVLAFSPDGKTLAFGGAGVVHLFDLSDGDK